MSDDPFARIRDEIASLRQRAWIEQLAANRLDACVQDLIQQYARERTYRVDLGAQLTQILGSQYNGVSPERVAKELVNTRRRLEDTEKELQELQEYMREQQEKLG